MFELNFCFFVEFEIFKKSDDAFAKQNLLKFSKFRRKTHRKRYNLYGSKDHWFKNNFFLLKYEFHGLTRLTELKQGSFWLQVSKWLSYHRWLGRDHWISPCLLGSLSITWTSKGFTWGLIIMGQKGSLMLIVRAGVYKGCSGLNRSKFTRIHYQWFTKAQLSSMTWQNSFWDHWSSRFLLGSLRAQRGTRMLIGGHNASLKIPSITRTH